jgi:hypothetical protein
MEKTLATIFSISILTLFILSASGKATIITSGDGGSAFATDTSINKCRENNNSNVFLCSGNVVKVGSTLDMNGSVFYKPDGGVVDCPDVEPTDMGAECVQLLHPNACQNKTVCANLVYDPIANKSVVKTDDTDRPYGVGVPDIELNFTQTEIPAQEQKGVLGQDTFVFAIILVGMFAVAIINYVNFKSKEID